MLKGKHYRGGADMYLMYVDESGDSGVKNSPTAYYVLTGVVVHELRWHSNLNRIVDFRKRMKSKFGLRLNEEIHSAKFINRPGDLVRIKRNDRLAILRAFANELALLQDVNIINVIVDKTNKVEDYDVFTMAWKALIQRFENTISRKNFPGPANPDERGIVFPDHTEDKKLKQLLRQMRRYNPVQNQPSFGIGYRNLQLSAIVEDPNFRSSLHSYYIQLADLAAFLAYQHLKPNGYMKKKQGHRYFVKLDNVLCKVASRTDPQGIVWL